MLLADLITILDTIAPTRHAESWDNVGLITGDPSQPVHRALLTIDYTQEVAAEARQHNCELVIAYHPPIFDPLKRITAPSLIYGALRGGIALYSPHTALDVAPGGTNDMLADAAGLPADARQPLKLIEPQSRQHKLIVFVPEDAVEHIAAAMFDAGAGRIGNYTSCSFQSKGTGTFFGQDAAHPAVGQPGRLERVPEVRLETVLPLSQVEPVIRALRRAHPYEEPAFDLVQLALPAEGLGMGRIGELPEPADRQMILDRIKQQLDLRHLLVAGPRTGPVRRIAVCAGACGNLLADALQQKADLYLTGETRHHDALKAAAAGMTVVCTLHSNSERAVLKRVRDRLAKEAADVAFVLSASDRDPFVIT